MGINYTKKCARCGEFGVEFIDDWESWQCPKCNDRDIERANEQREWNYWHGEEK